MIAFLFSQVRQKPKKQSNMAIRSKSRTKENSSTANETKRQPFGLIADGASRKTNSQKRTKERRKSRQIGDDVVLYVRLVLIISTTELISI